MLKDFKSDLLAIQSNSEDYELCGLVLNKIANWNVSESSEDRETVAELFYATLKVIQSMESDEIIEKISEDAILAFENINQIAKTGKESSSLVLIDFLNDLYQRRKNLSSKINVSQDELVILLKDLEPIKFIFLLCDQDGDRYFPINRLLSNIVMDPTFINTKIEPYHINLLQLAVEMYKVTREEVGGQFDELIEKCNLKFIEYLNGACIKVDTMDMCNYRNNQVMVFYDANKQKVLIRHENRAYFDDRPEGIKIKSETNVNKRPIGYFVEMEVNGTAIDYSDAIGESPKEFLRLLYERKCKNVLIEKMILKTPDGKYESLNPFCKKDKWIVKGQINGKEGKVCLPDRIIECIEEGRLQLFSDGNNHKVLDRVSLGLCLSLLEKKTVDIDSLFANIEEEDWIQNILIKNWVCSTGDFYESLEFALLKYANDLDYCVKEEYIKNLRFEKGRIREVMPYSFSLKWVYEGLDLPEEASIFIGSITEDDEEEFCIDFSPIANKSIAKTLHTEISYISSADVNLSGETDVDEFYKDGSNRYFVYKNGEWYSSYELQNIFKALVMIELLNCRMIDYDINSCVHDNSFAELKRIMKLHQKELSDIEIKKVDLESLFVIRLAGNLLLNKIHSDNWNDFYNIFVKQQILTFEDVVHDKQFSNKEEGILIVPKDRSQEDAVLRKVYENYIRVNAERDQDWWYAPKGLTNDNGEFCFENSRITVIRFLFDNTEHGTATIRTLAANLGKENEWIEFEKNRTGQDEAVLQRKIAKQVEKCQQYKCGESSVKLKDISSANNPRIEACSYFGTEEGDKLISDFLIFCGIDETNFSVTHNKDIIRKSELVKSECEKLGIDYDDKIYIVIREFNMPKKSLLPLGAVGKAENIATLLVKKSEI